MNICVVGTGYVGLVTGAVLADLGNDVGCVDNDRSKVDLLRADFKLLRSVVEINRERAAHLTDVIRKALGPFEDNTVAVLGLAFKPNTDDMREAKSLEVIRMLHAGSAHVRADDPVAMVNARALVPESVTFSDSA